MGGSYAFVFGVAFMLQTYVTSFCYNLFTINVWLKFVHECRAYF